MKARLIFLAAAALAGCDATMPATVQAEMPCQDDGPCVMQMPDQTRANTPLMGFVTGVSGGQSFRWETYDFSVGAFDASAWMQLEDGVPRLTIHGYDPEDETLEGTYRIEMSGTLPHGFGPGAAADVSLALIDGRGRESPRYASVGPATLNVTVLTRNGDDRYGTVSGNYAASLCRAASETATPDPADCRDLAGTFETRLQFDNF